MSVVATNAALRALLDRCGRDAICEAFLDALTRDPLVTGASVRLSDGTTWARGRANGQPFQLHEVGGTFTMAAGPDTFEAELLAELLDRLLLVEQRQGELSRARTTEVRSLVHDIRSLLAVMLGHCEIMESGLGGELNPRQRKSVASIKRQVDRCEQLLTERRGRLVDPAP